MSTLPASIPASAAVAPTIPRTRPAVRLLTHVVTRLLTQTIVSGRENLPPSGPLLITFNHIGHMDAVALIGTLPYEIEAVALADLYNVPVTGQMLRLYGCLAVHRDVFDRGIVEQITAVLRGGGVVALAPEARQSVTGALEKARGGAAYLALKTRAPIMPVALTGTENRIFYPAWKSLRRPHVTLTIGKPFHLPDLPLAGAGRKQSLEDASTIIMTCLAELLPPAYRGVYADLVATPAPEGQP